NEFVPVEVYQALQAVPRLTKGRTTARESAQIEPVPDAILNKTLPLMPPVVADMARIQRLCGMRPQEVCNMRFCDIDRSGKVWRYVPFEHKTEHHGKSLTKAIGPKAQAILTSYLMEKEFEPEEFLFAPNDSEIGRKITMRQARKSKVQPSQIARFCKMPHCSQLPAATYRTLSTNAVP
ncbi:MAG: hypothetical protein ACRC2T_13440, partial [Thermoguttaceae bacterium]